MKKLLTFLVLLTAFSGFSQLKIISWNVENLGKSKSDSTIQYIANTLKDYDVVALQEIVAGYGGSQAVAKLVNELNTKGAKWEYSVSEPTTSSAYKTERYAFLWKPSKVKLIGKPWLEKKYNKEIDREPYYATFEYDKKQITLVNFHAITKAKQPETEIKYFKFLPTAYPLLNLFFLGDFNCPQTHTVFNPLKKMGYESVFKNQKTSLKKECKNNDCLASEFDNMFYNTKKVKITKSKAIHFYKDFKTLESARAVTDHIPLAVEVNLF